jgi:hypothetical protein
MKVWCLRWCLVTKRPARLSTNLAFGTRRFWILLSSSSKIARSSVLSVQCWRRRLMGRFSLPRSLLLALSFWICWRTVCSHSRGCDINTTDSMATAAGSAVVAWWPVTRTMDWTVRIRSPRSLNLLHQTSCRSMSRNEFAFNHGQKRVLNRMYFGTRSIIEDWYDSTGVWVLDACLPCS